MKTNPIKTLPQLEDRIIELKRLIANASMGVDSQCELITIHMNNIPDNVIHEYAELHKLRAIAPDRMTKRLWCSEKTPWGKIFIESSEKELVESFMQKDNPRKPQQLTGD